MDLVRLLLRRCEDDHSLILEGFNLILQSLLLSSKGLIGGGLFGSGGGVCLCRSCGFALSLGKAGRQRVDIGLGGSYSGLVVGGEGCDLSLVLGGNRLLLCCKGCSRSRTHRSRALLGGFGARVGGVSFARQSGDFCLRILRVALQRLDLGLESIEQRNCFVAGLRKRLLLLGEAGSGGRSLSGRRVGSNEGGLELGIAGRNRRLFSGQIGVGGCGGGVQRLYFANEPLRRGLGAFEGLDLLLQLRAEGRDGGLAGPRLLLKREAEAVEGGLPFRLQRV